MFVVKNPRGDIVDIKYTEQDAIATAGLWNILYQENAYYWEPWKENYNG